MATNMLDNTKMTNVTAKESIPGQTVIHMMAIFLTQKNMALDCLYTQTKIATLDSTKTIKSMAKVCLSGQMAVFILENSRMTNETAKEF
jgi:hypothetical protein